MKILHISTHNENCGIGKYQEMYLQAMLSSDKRVEQTFFPYSPNKISKLDKDGFTNITKKLKEYVQEYDLVHIQHEFSFFKAWQLEMIVKTLKEARKPFVSTIHTKPLSDTLVMSKFSPRWPVAKARNVLSNKRYTQAIMPLKDSKIVFVHNTFTKNGLVELGFDEQKIILKPIPVPNLSPNMSDEAKSFISLLDAKISRDRHDIVFATVGYIAEVKGVFEAVKSLRLLPKNYKLVILGGIHPRAENDYFLNEIANYIADYGLTDRIYITGFIESDEVLNSAISSVDVVVYPYLREYASSSAALNNAFANSKPIIAFRAPAFVELNEHKEYMKLCESFSYYDLAREISNLNPDNLRQLASLSNEYRTRFSYKKLGQELLENYRSVIENRSS